MTMVASNIWSDPDLGLKLLPLPPSLLQPSSRHGLHWTHRWKLLKCWHKIFLWLYEISTCLTVSATRPWLYGSRRTRDADELLRHRSAPSLPRLSAPLQGRTVSRQVQADESHTTAFVASTHGLRSCSLTCVICPFRAPHVEFVALDAVRCSPMRVDAVRCGPMRPVQ